MGDEKAMDVVLTGIFLTSRSKKASSIRYVLETELGHEHHLAIPGLLREITATLLISTPYLLSPPHSRDYSPDPLVTRVLSPPGGKVDVFPFAGGSPLLTTRTLR